MDFERKKSQHLAELKMEKVRKETSLTKKLKRAERTPKRESLLSRIDSIIQGKTEKIKTRRHKRKEAIDEKYSKLKFKPHITNSGSKLNRSYEDLMKWFHKRNRNLAVKRMNKQIQETVGFQSERKRSGSKLKIEDRLLISGKMKEARLKSLRKLKFDGYFQPKINKNSEKILRKGKENDVKISEFMPLNEKLKKNKKVRRKIDKSIKKRKKNFGNKKKKTKKKNYINFVKNSKSRNRSKTPQQLKEKAILFINTNPEIKKSLSPGKKNSGLRAAQKMLSSLRNALLNKKKNPKNEKEQLLKSETEISSSETEYDIVIDYEGIKHEASSQKESEGISDIDSLISDSKIRETNDIFFGRKGIKKSFETKENFSKHKIVGISEIYT